jgi:hypothetical protein
MDVKVEDLCSTLKASDANNSYLGYLTDNKSGAPNYEPISLEDLLTSNDCPKLTRKQQFRLANILTSSLLQLQTTPWLTEKLEKISSSTAAVLKSSPSIPLSSTLSPPSNMLPLPQRRIHTPSRFTTRTYLVSLGILLLELCFNTPIESRLDLSTPHLINGEKTTIRII